MFAVLIIWTMQDYSCIILQHVLYLVLCDCCYLMIKRQHLEFEIRLVFSNVLTFSLLICPYVWFLSGLSESGVHSVPSGSWHNWPLWLTAWQHVITIHAIESREITSHVMLICAGNQSIYNANFDMWQCHHGYAENGLDNIVAFLLLISK